MKEAKPLWQIFGFPSTLFSTGTEYSQLSVRQRHKCGVQGAEVIDTTIGDNSVHPAARCSDLPLAGGWL